MTERDYIAEWNERIERHKQRRLFGRCIWGGILIYCATHAPGHFLIWMFTFQWI